MTSRLYGRYQHDFRVTKWSRLSFWLCARSFDFAFSLLSLSPPALSLLFPALSSFHSFLLKHFHSFIYPARKRKTNPNRREGNIDKARKKAGMDERKQEEKETKSQSFPPFFSRNMQNSFRVTIDTIQICSES